jgi:hypothetical protein
MWLNFTDYANINKIIILSIILRVFSLKKATIEGVLSAIITIVY